MTTRGDLLVGMNRHECFQYENEIHVDLRCRGDTPYVQLDLDDMRELRQLYYDQRDWRPRARWPLTRARIFVAKGGLEHWLPLGELWAELKKPDVARTGRLNWEQFFKQPADDGAPRSVPPSVHNTKFRELRGWARLRTLKGMSKHQVGAQYLHAATDRYAGRVALNCGEYDMVLALRRADPDYKYVLTRVCLTATDAECWHEWPDLTAYIKEQGQRIVWGRGARSFYVLPIALDRAPTAKEMSEGFDEDARQVQADDWQDQADKRRKRK